MTERDNAVERVMSVLDTQRAFYAYYENEDGRRRVAEQIVAALANQPAAQVSDADVAEAAKLVHDEMYWAAEQAGPPSRWQNGNSLAEGRARNVARALLTTPPRPDAKLVEALEQIKRLCLNAEGHLFDLILSYADNALLNLGGKP